MNWIDIFFGKQTPKQILKAFKGLAAIQLAAFVFHLDDIYSNPSQPDWIWKAPLKLSSLDADVFIHQKYQVPNNIDIHTASSNIVFHFATFSEWLNRYTVGFIIFDTLKWLIGFFIIWQFSRIISEKNNFTGFTTEGVKYLRYAAVPIMFIPILDVITNRIFINYAAQQSTNLAFKGLLLTPNTDIIFGWLYYMYATTILLGLAEIFRYGMQLKEETDLTV